MDIQKILFFLPEVKRPTEKKLSFNVKLKWTLLILAFFFLLANIPIYGLSKNVLSRFDYLAIIFATEFGSIISLGIGPIVTASIIIQLLVGSGILNIDTKTTEGKKYFQGLQRITVIFFIIFESTIYVLMGFLEAVPGFMFLVIFQLILGGFAIVLMDEVVQKWGFGSGVSLFIVAGVAWRIMNGLIQFIGPNGANCLMNFSETPCSGDLLVIVQSLINGDSKQILLALFPILITTLIFLVVVWAQSLKVEVPLSYERIRGFSMKWPLPFFYASNLPVILVAALIANIQLLGGLVEKWVGHPTIIGGFSNGVPISGFAYWVGHSNIIESLIKGNFYWAILLQSLGHLVFYMTFGALFAVFWVKTSGMDETNQAKNILSSGLQIPGFRKDERVLESILKRYIMPLTIMGGIAIGALAAFADLLGALTSGTAILLAVTIIYQFYQNIAQQHAVDMHPALKKMIA